MTMTLEQLKNIKIAIRVTDKIIVDIDLVEDLQCW